MAGQKTDERDVYVGQRIAEQRRRASLTQRVVATRFGMSAAQLQKYEKGKNRIAAIHLDEFSRMVGVPMEHFFVGMPGRDGPSDGFAEGPQPALAEVGPAPEVVGRIAAVLGTHVPPAGWREITAALTAGRDGKP